MRLGALAVKLAQAQPQLTGAAQQPQGLFATMGRGAQATHQLHGRRASKYELGPTAAQQGGFVTGQQAAMEGILSTLGPFGLIAYQYLQPQINGFLQKEMGIDLAKPYQVGYGGNVAAFKENQRIVAQLMSQQVQNRGEIVKRFADTASDATFNFLKDKLGINISPETEQWVRDSVKNMSPQAAGMFIQNIGMVIPEVNTIMSHVDPSFISDFSPLVHATRLRNNGEFNEQVFRNTVERFNQAYQSGQFPGMPAQVAMNAMDYAIESMGSQANTAHAANIAAVANDLVQRGLAPSFGAAMALAGSIDPNGGATDPSKVRRYAAYLDDLARRGGVDKKHIYEAARYAQQKGMSIGAAMSAVGASARVRTGLSGAGELAGTTADMAAQAVAQLPGSDNMKLLAAAYEVDPKARRMISSAIERGDARTLTRIAQNARFSSKIMSLRNVSDPNALANQMAMANPRLLEAMAVFNVTQGARKNRELQSVLGNKKELIRRLKERDFTGLRPATVRALRARGGQALATALLEDKELRGSLRGGRRLRAPEIEELEVPSRLGFNYPGRDLPETEELGSFVRRTAAPPPPRYKPPGTLGKLWRGVQRGAADIAQTGMDWGRKGVEWLGK